MFFQKIKSKKIQDAIKSLTTDKEFHKILNEDKKLDDLDDEKFNPEKCLREFKSTLGMKFEYNRP